MHTLTTIIIVILSALTGNDTSLSCQDAKAKLGSEFNAPVYFVLASGSTETLWLAHYDDSESNTYSVSFPNDGDALQGTFTFQSVEILGERHHIANPLTVECGTQKHTVFLPIVKR